MNAVCGMKMKVPFTGFRIFYELIVLGRAKVLAGPAIFWDADLAAKLEVQHSAVAWLFFIVLSSTAYALKCRWLHSYNDNSSLAEVCAGVKCHLDS